MAETHLAPDVPDFVVFRSVFYYCFMIIVIPVVTFFSAKFVVFDGIFRMSNVPSNVYAAIATIVTLHVILGLYIYRAYHETGSTISKPAAKRD